MKMQAGLVAHGHAVPARARSPRCRELSGQPQALLLGLNSKQRRLGAAAGAARPCATKRLQPCPLSKMASQTWDRLPPFTLSLTAEVSIA
jgi:hypothetical protein